MDKKRISQEEFDKAVEQHNKYVEDAEQGEKAAFKDVFFEKIDMSDKQLNGASFENCYFKECDLKDAGLCFADIKGCLFDRCNANQLVAEEATIKDTTFEKCDMTKSFFTHSCFDDVRFIECDIMDISFQYALGEVEINPERKKPRCKLVGSDGNIFALLGVASSALKKNGQREDAENMRERVYASQSYYEALGIITEYVDDESMSEDYDESDDISM
ncbi:Pentapeptide repeat-containing protein [Ruminococcaceae bacterium FB2012]|nr:Pentapeptide repeat-containing protein [Ruminococcaceae bacterium FB2012]